MVFGMLAVASGVVKWDDQRSVTMGPAPGKAGRRHKAFQDSLANGICVEVSADARKELGDALRALVNVDYMDPMVCLADHELNLVDAVYRAM